MVIPSFRLVLDSPSKLGRDTQMPLEDNNLGIAEAGFILPDVLPVGA